MAWQYVPPLRDMRFVIDEVLRLPPQWAAIDAFAGVDGEVAQQVLAEAGRFAAGVLAPLNARGDREGCTLGADGRVRTPAGFADAYRAFVDAGWPALAWDEADGGQGLPKPLDAALYEMLVSANHGWTMYPALLHGAGQTLRAHGSDALKARYLPGLVSGRTLATMCLTEAQAGSDLGLVRTRAEPQADGSFRLHGQKIFISGGDHDLTEHIVHLVLARVTGAPPGTKGLSLFLVPSALDDGTRNAVQCTGIEHKMGLHGSATCALGFDGATGWIVGEPGRGLAAMFVMMNAARLHVALQGLAHAELAHQNALRYAHERLQGRAVMRPPGADDAACPPGADDAGCPPGADDAGCPPGAGAAAADPIAWHAPVRRTLLRQRALVEGSRIVAYEAAHQLDRAARAADPAARARASEHAALLTPVLKAMLTEQGFQIASDALQVFGGHGYLHDWGAEQCLRDSRIAMIYEGSNEIQAIDLLLRKLLPDGGAAFRRLLDALRLALPATSRHGEAARAAIDALGEAVGPLLAAAAADAEAPHRACGDFLRATGLVLLAQAWARADAVAEAALARDPVFYQAKRDSARCFFDDVLPELDLRLRLLGGRGALPFIDVPRG